MNKRSYSNSRLGEFEECPKSYWYHRVKRVEPVEELTPVYFHLGTVVHEVLQNLYEGIMNGERKALPELLSLYDKLWDEGMKENRVYFPSPHQEEGQKERGKRYVESYFNRFSPFNKDSTLWVEKRKEFPLDEPRGIYINGKIDRLAQEEEGVYVIHDFKTSTILPSPSSLQKDRQMVLYTLMVQHHLKDARKLWAVWHYLNFDMEIRLALDTAEIERVKSEVLSLIERIETSTESDFIPLESKNCADCGYRHICPAAKQGGNNENKG